MVLPDLIFVAGVKRSGKDFLCDTLVERAGFTKVHIVEQWLRQWCVDRGLDPDRWEEHKAVHRQEVQADATAARKNDPLCLVRPLLSALPSLPRPLCVTAVRFQNEIDYGRNAGAWCIRVEVPNLLRYKRFLDAGENINLFNDPFENEVDHLTVDAVISGALQKGDIIRNLRTLAYSWFRQRQPLTTK